MKLLNYETINKITANLTRAFFFLFTLFPWLRAWPGAVTVIKYKAGQARQALQAEMIKVLVRKREVRRHHTEYKQSEDKLIKFMINNDCIILLHIKLIA